MDALEQLGPILRTWDLGGAQTYGVARLSAAWERRPAYLDALAPRRVTVGASNDSDFGADLQDGLLVRDRDALFFLFERGYPPGEAAAVHRQLRAWVLLHALRLLQSSPAPDQLVSAIARSLAHAALETDTQSWRVFLSDLGGPTDKWEEINARVIARADKTASTRPAPHRHFLTAGAQLAKGGSKPFVTGESESAGQLEVEAQAWIERYKDSPRRDADSEDAFSVLVAAAPFVGSASASEEVAADAALELAAFEVDPRLTPEEQTQAVNAVRFQLGAAARFVPWDWPQLVPPERVALLKLVADGVASPTDAAERLLAAIANIALVAGLNLDEAAAIPLDAGLGSACEIWIDLESGHVARTPPRPSTHWKPTAATTSLLRPAASALRIEIPSPTADVLRQAKRERSRSTLLGHLWPAAAPSLQGEFSRWVQQGHGTSRIRSSMLAKVLGQTAFERSGDAVFARLLGSNRATALPASTAYTAYSADQLISASPGISADVPGTGPLPLNVAGSLLESVDDDLVNSSIADLWEDVLNARDKLDWARFHNAVALYWDAALRAATGARPVKGLWSSEAAFDWADGAVYIDDKASPVAATGRLVPLPADLCFAFKSIYIDRHLPWLFATYRIELGDLPKALPGLLFILEEEDGPLSPVPLENKHRTLRGRRRIEGQLPMNLFRHRLRTLLHREPGVDLEVVDTVLGHGDNATTLTHGNFSMRVWRRDADALRPALTNIFRRLDFKTPPLWTAEPSLEPLPYFNWTSDGASERAGQRGIAEARHRAAADATILKFVAGVIKTGRLDVVPEAPDSGQTAPADESIPPLIALLDEQQLDELSRQLLAGESGMPSPSGVLQYERLIEHASAAWDRLGARIPLRRRYAGREIEDSPFNSLAAQASSNTAELRRRLDGLFDAAGERTRITLKKALSLAIFDLVITSRITNHLLLKDVVTNDRRWRVIRYADDFYLEWNPSVDLLTNANAPAQRFSISLRCAWLLSQSVRGTTRRDTAWASSLSLVLPLQQVCMNARCVKQLDSADELLVAVVSLVDQANVVELPGSVAGFLAGRVMTASLGWGDWVRLKSARWIDLTTLPSSRPGEAAAPEDEQQRLQLADLPEDSENEFELSAETCFVAVRDPQDASLGAEASKTAAFKLFKEVRQQLSDQDTSKGSKHRARAAERMSLEIQGKAGTVSTAVQLLSLWAVDLLLRPGRSRKLATSSVLTYFSALSPSFQSVAYAVDITALDDFELESFYVSVLDGSSAAYKKQAYIGLRNFHKFAQTAAGIPEIDWSSVAVADQVNLGSPGFIDEDSYFRVLELLSTGGAGILGWQLQCIALFAFRFGLRGGEAVGLRRSDLLLDGEQPYLTVRNNRERDLKSTASRRLVPLLFELSQSEREALARLANFHAFDGVGLDDAPAFASSSDPSEIIDGLKARALINDALKAITGQRSSSMHKLRKAFVMRTWRALEAPDFHAPGLPKECDAVAAKIRATLLGTDRKSVSRRGAWAVARSVGHAHVQSTLRSYAHILSDVAIDLVAASKCAPSLGLKPDLVKVQSLDQFPDYSHTPRQSETGRTTFEPVDGLRALLFLSRGRSASEAAQYAGLPFQRVEVLGDISNRIFRKLVDSDPSRLGQNAKSPRSRRLAPGGILSLVHVNAHARLRRGLANLPFSALNELAETEAIRASDWAAFVGSRREIVMWRPNHFRLAALAVRHLLQPSARSKTRLFSPRPMDKMPGAQRLISMATDAGWLARQDVGLQTKDDHRPLCESIEATSRLPGVRLDDEGVTVVARIVLRLTGADSTDSVSDGVELVTALAILNAFCKATE